MTLNEYILVANRFLDADKVSEHQTSQREYEEDGMTVFHQQDSYRFADGKLLECDREIDDVVSDMACSECWIVYVLKDNCGQVLGKKSFISFCQESFWLKRQYHQLVEQF